MGGWPIPSHSPLGFISIIINRLRRKAKVSTGIGVEESLHSVGDRDAIFLTPI
jgi:hypothetical protein